MRIVRLDIPSLYILQLVVLRYVVAATLTYGHAVYRRCP